MDNIKKLDALVLKATSESLEEIPTQILEQILLLINERADMPKHVIASISKRMALKNKRVLTNVFVLLEYLGYQCQLSLYSQISSKEFLFKISGLLMNKDMDPEVKNKIMQTVYCWEQLFRPHEDLLPLFFQFYAGMLRNGFDIPHGYKSKFRPAQLKQYKKPPTQVSSVKNSQKRGEASKKSVVPTINQKKTFQQIREKLILTNQIIDNTNPAQNVKDNGLLLEMIEQVKECQKKVNKTINENPTEVIMELALAANDDIFITYRRFKDLQRNKKPEPFILTQLASDIQRETQTKKSQSYVSERNSKQPVQNIIKKQKDNFMDFDEPPKVQQKKHSKQESIFDMDFVPQPPPKKQQPKNSGGDIFDLLGDGGNNNQSSNINKVQNPVGFDLLSPGPQIPHKNLSPSLDLGNFDSLLITNQFQPVPPPSGNGISLGGSPNNLQFTTEADFKNYDKKSPLDRFDELTYQFLKK